MFSAIANLIGSMWGYLQNMRLGEMSLNQQAEDTAATNATNMAMTTQTNANNLKIARETNAANAQQAELAYQRSKPINQMFDMMQAGMSKAAAAQKIAGGGQYSPAQMIGAEMVAPHAEKANYDFSLFRDAIRSLSDAPSNVMQGIQQDLQFEQAQQQLEFAQNEERRKQQMHDLEVDEKLYSKWERTSMDDFMSTMENKAQELNRQPKENESLHEYVRSLGLQNDPNYKKLPASTRQRAFDHFKQAQEEKRAQDESRDRSRAAQDAHDLAEITKYLEGVKMPYAKASEKAKLMNILRSNENLLEDGKIKFQDARSKEFENYVREMGIDSEAEARRLGQLCEKLSKDDELDIQYKRQVANKNTLGVWNMSRVLLRDLGELLIHVKL